MRLTERQAEIVRLIAEGCSDKEVAARLGISRRTVRTHLEKIYAKHGIRSRTKVAAEWLRQENEVVRPVAADECPFPRPFPEDFADCPAYLPKVAVTLDLSAQPVDLIRSCRHLEIRRLAERPDRRYGACVIGDAAARDRWVRTIGAERLRQIGVLRHELASVALPLFHELWTLKNRDQRRADPAEREPSRAMEAVAARLLEAVRAFLDEHRPVLDALEIPADACLRLIGLWLDSFVGHADADARWQAPVDLMESFPAEIRLFLAPAHSVPLGGAT